MRTLGPLVAALILGTAACDSAAVSPVLAPTTAPADPGAPTEVAPAGPSVAPTRGADTREAKRRTTAPSWVRAGGAGLDWLVRHQEADGSWDPSRFADRCAGSGCGADGDPGDAAAATSLAVVAFLALGEMPSGSRSESSRAVRSGLAYLLSVQDADGTFRSPGAEHPVRTQAHATRAVGFAAGTGAPASYVDPARRGLDRLLALRTPGSAWGERDAAGAALAADLTTTTWALYAIGVAGLALDTNVPPEVSRDVVAWLDSLPGDATPEAAAMRTICRFVCGAKEDDPRLRADREILERSYVAGATETADGSGPWLRAQAAYVWGGDVLRSARRYGLEVVTARQRGEPDGCPRGSWDPPAAVGAKQPSDPERSRIGATAFALGLLAPQFHSTYRNSARKAEETLFAK